MCNRVAGGIVGAWGSPSSHNYCDYAQVYVLCATDLLNTMCITNGIFWDNVVSVPKCRYIDIFTLTY